MRPGDYRQCLKFCQQILRIFDDNEDTGLLMRKEAHAQSDIFINKQSIDFGV